MGIVYRLHLFLSLYTAHYQYIIIISIRRHQALKTYWNEKYSFVNFIANTIFFRHNHSKNMQLCTSCIFYNTIFDIFHKKILIIKYFTIIDTILYGESYSSYKKLSTSFPILLSSLPLSILMAETSRLINAIGADAVFKNILVVLRTVSR